MQTATKRFIEDAVKAVFERGHASTSLLQRRLHLSYADAYALMDELERLKIVSVRDGSKPSELLMTIEDALLAIE